MLRSEVMSITEILNNEFVPMEDVQDLSQFTTNDNPEKALMRKERFRALSREARFVMKVIFESPDLFLKKNGRLKLADLKKYMKENCYWAEEKTSRAVMEVRLTVIFS